MTGSERAIRWLIVLLHPLAITLTAAAVCTRSDPNESNHARISAYRAAASGCRGARLTMNAAGTVIVSADPYSRRHPRFLLGLGQVAGGVEAIVSELTTYGRPALH
jgi:uncharacterized RDD family membrane protein YckC